MKTLLATDNCVGIIGGRPKHSLYFVGFQEDNLIHLDPHLVQQNVNVSRCVSVFYYVNVNEAGGVEPHVVAFIIGAISP